MAIVTQRSLANSLSSDLFPIRSGKRMRCAGSKDERHESPSGPCFIFLWERFLALGSLVSLPLTFHQISK